MAYLNLVRWFFGGLAAAALILSVILSGYVYFNICIGLKCAEVQTIERNDVRLLLIPAGTCSIETDWFIGNLAPGFKWNIIRRALLLKYTLYSVWYLHLWRETGDGRLVLIPTAELAKPGGTPDRERKCDDSLTVPLRQN